MKAIVVEITFYEAFFKVHYTKGFRLTYPMPLPTSVAGIFGAMLGVERGKITSEFNSFLFGADLVDYKGLIIENETFIQYKSAKVEKGVVRTQIVNHPTYLIAMSGEESKIKEYYEFLKDGNMVFLPYGGQNDFFVEDIKIRDLCEVFRSNAVSNYAPQDLVERFETSETTINILPVMHTYSENPNFYFVLKGRLRLKKPVDVAGHTGIAIYPLGMFKYVRG